MDRAGRVTTHGRAPCWWRAAAVLAVAVTLAACGAQEVPDVPEGAVHLQANVPTRVSGLSVVAGNVEQDGAVLSVSDGSAPATTVDLAVGDEAEVLGVTFTLVATRVGDDDRPTLPDADVWVLADQG